MPRLSPEQVIAKMATNERADMATMKIGNVADRISGLLALAECNALIVYSPLLASQIPPSTAGHAFNTFQRAMHGFEIVQLCAVWDKADHSLAYNSIPTVHALIDHDDVVASGGIPKAWTSSLKKSLISIARRTTWELLSWRWTTTSALSPDEGASGKRH